MEESEGGREQLLGLAEVKPHVDKVTSLKRDKGMAGIHDLIDWTLAQVQYFVSKVHVKVSFVSGAGWQQQPCRCTSLH